MVATKSILTLNSVQAQQAGCAPLRARHRVRAPQQRPESARDSSGICNRKARHRHRRSHRARAARSTCPSTSHLPPFCRTPRIAEWSVDQPRCELRGTNPNRFFVLMTVDATHAAGGVFCSREADGHGVMRACSMGMGRVEIGAHREDWPRR